jgi:hypothetical protein
MRLHRSLALVPVLAFAPVLAAQKAVAEPRVGLQFAPPKGWLELPGDHDRHATLRLFAAPRALASKGEGNHTPVLRVMFFGKGGDASKDLVDGLPRMTPFRSLEDFAQRGLGAKDVAKEAHKVGTADGQHVTAKDMPGDHILFGQTVTLDDGEAAVCIELLANHVDKLKKDIDAVLASLEPVARVAATRTEVPWLADAEWTKKDAAARTAARRKWAEDLVAAAAKNPELGYKVSKSKYWTVLSAADPAFTKKAVDAAEAGRDWLAKHMPEITKDAPLPAVLRVFDGADPNVALQIARNDQREYDQLHRELFAVNDRDNGGPTGFGPVLRGVLWQIFDDVDPAVLPAMPRWFDNGLWEFLRSSKVDGKKLDFAAGDVERGRLDYYRQKNEEMPPLWGLIQEKSQVSPTDGSLEKDWGYTPESARLIRWLWQFDGLKAFNKPTLVSDYVKALAAAHDKLGPDPVGDVPTIGLTDDQKKERNNRFYKWRDALLIATNDIALPLQPDTWKAINEKWIAFNKAFK